MKLNKPVALSIVVVVAQMAALAVSLKTGLNTPLESDAEQYKSIAVNLAAGQGYRSDATFWPTEPTLQRMPGWPILVSLFLWVTPDSAADAVMRLLCCLLNAGVALVIAVMTQHLTGRWGPAVVAGLLYGLHPVGLFLSAEAASEMLFLFLVGASLVLMVWHPRRRPIAIMLAALACLERANFVLWLPVWLGLTLVVALVWQRQWLSKRLVAHALVYCILFAIPTGAWLLRNHAVTGHFPVLSTLRGQTFYGGNNEVVANDLNWWGYWIFPDKIPGETPLAKLALEQGLSEYDVDCRYQASGVAYVREHALEMPRLCLGKLIRAYVPVPWKPLIGSYVVSAYRIAIDILALIGVFLIAGRITMAMGLHLLSFLVVNVITVVLFWGNYRFAFAFEPFLIPFAAVALAAIPSFLRSVGSVQSVCSDG